MMPELGNFLLCLAAGLALLLSVYPLWGAARQDRRLMALARPLAWGLFACIGGAFLLLVHAFVVNDFTVRYVAENSNSALPVWYRVAATWGAHEGSLLLWVLLLSVWTFAVAIFSRRMPLDAVARVLAVMGMIAFGFLLFILFTSNPFSRGLPQYPIDGRDLNPLLQDIGMIFHPPILYMGYVGFSVAFAFAIASLLAGRLDTAWARWSRPWTQAAWMFLTLGIVLGSAWAYYELGWGGWWFWDPVENASFMPWLVGTALLHSLAVTEKRGSFRAWTVLLAIAAFSLCLLGTFLGGLVATHMPTLFLKVFFICFLGFVSLQMLSNYRPPASREMPGALGTAGVGGVIGLISSFVGIGGGTLSVPFMSFCNVPLHHAVGTSAAIGFPIAVAGTLGYIVGGWNAPGLPAGCVGFVNLMAFFGIAAASFMTAPIGARLSHSLPTAKLKKGFAVFLIIVALRMLVGLF